MKTPDNEEINPMPIMATDNFEVTVSMMTYFLNSYYRSFVSTNQLYLGQLGLDPSRDLDDQKYSEEYTWLDYFLFYLSDTLKQQLIIAEAAKAAGFELSKDDIDNIENWIRQNRDNLLAYWTHEIDSYELSEILSNAERIQNY